MVGYERERTTAHRIAFKLNGGVIPHGHYVLHRCDNPPCCNPAHLFVGTQKQNLEDMRRKGRAGDCRNIGERHGMCKLADSQVAEIRKLYATPVLSQDKLAAMFGVGQSQISRILRRESRCE
jgi:hypothetical protein